MQTLGSVDVVIVGGGWSGMVMAQQIATRTPLSVLVLEHGGPFRGAGAYAREMDEVDTYIRKRHAENLADETYTTAPRPDRANPLRQYGELPWMGTGMGGSGDHWGASSPRLMPEALGSQVICGSAMGLRGCRRTLPSRISASPGRDRALLYPRRGDDGDERQGRQPQR